MFPLGRKSMVGLLVVGIGVGLSVLTLMFLADKRPPRSESTSHSIPSLKDLTNMPPGDLALQDIAVMNLACAEGLYGAEHLNIRTCLRQLDQWAETASRLTKQNEFRFAAQARKTGNSINRWRCAALVQYLNQVVGLSYNPRLKGRPISRPDETSQFHDSRDLFIHGLITESNRGTCASMPVLFAAVARRMGYPIQLVTTRNHLFARWETPSEAFNIEMTDRFAEFKPDEFYRSFPSLLNPGEVERRGYLVSLTPDRELSAFLHLRALCLWNHGKLDDALVAFEASARLDPDYKEQGQQNYFILEVSRQIEQSKNRIQEEGNEKH